MNQAPMKISGSQLELVVMQIMIEEIGNGRLESAAKRIIQHVRVWENDPREPAR